MKLPTWQFSLPKAFSLGKTWQPVALTAAHMTLLAACPVLLFLAFFDPNVLNPTRLGWVLINDWGQHVLGWNAFRHVGWAGFNRENLLAAPAGYTPLYTDSNPPLAFFFKIFRDYLPANFQYIGPWFGLCVGLHFFFAYKLIRPHAPNRWAAIGGAVALSALPCLYYRERHDTLVAQWMLLWGLHLFINVRDPINPADVTRRTLSWATLLNVIKSPKNWGWAALMGLAGMLHPYMLFMVAAIWSGEVLRDLIPAMKAMDRRALVDVALRTVFVFAFPLMTLGIAGAYDHDQSPGAAGWAYYSMALDALFNPVRPEFSTFMKAYPQNGGQSFEGYQYLGFGLLALITIAGFLYIITPEAKSARSFIGGLKPLAIPFIALFLLAVTNHAIIYNYTLFNFAIPDALKNTASVLRASGRFFWPISYCMILTALVVLFRSRPRIVAVALPCILLLQAIDLNGFAESLRNATSLASSPQVYYVTPSPAWDKLVTSAKGVDFYPVNVHFNDKLFYELSWRATSQGKPVNTMYGARENVAQIAHEQADQTAFRDGHINTDHLFVFLKQCDAPPALQPYLRMLDGVWIIPPAAARNLPLSAPQWDPIKSEVRFGWLDQGTCMLDNNWTRPDNDGTWSDGPKADVLIPISHVKFDTPAPKALDMDLQAQSRAPVTVAVLVNGRKVTDITLDNQRSTHSIHLPRAALHGENLKIRFVVEQPAKTTVAVAQPRMTGRGYSSASANTEMAKKQDAVVGFKLIDLHLVAPKPAHPAGAALAG